MARQTTIRRRPTARRTTGARRSPRSTRSTRPTARRTRARTATRSSRTTRARRSPRSASAASQQQQWSGLDQGLHRPVADRGIQRFLEGFTQALTSGDGRAAAACFEYPSLMVMSAVGDYGGTQAIPDAGQAAEFFGKAPEQYHAKGIEDTFPDIEGVQWIADDLALVKAHFPYIDADGNDMGDGETSVYVLRKQGSDYAICAAVTLGVDSERPRARSSSRRGR